MSQAGMARISQGNLPPAVPLQFVGDNGTIAVPAGNSITIFANNVANDNGSSVRFVNSGSISELHLSDASENIIIGENAGNSTLTGNGNVAIGVNAGSAFGSASLNVAIGLNAMENAVSAADCVAIGFGALQNAVFLNVNSTVAIGSGSCQNMDIGNDNVCIGYNSFRNATDGGSNTAIGYFSLRFNNGSFNTAIGNNAGLNYTGIEGNNIVIGSNGTLGDNNTIRIGNLQSRCFLAGVVGNSVTGSFVNISASGQLGTVASAGIGQTITGNTGGALSPTLGNWNIVTANTTVKFVGSGSTFTQDFGLSNLLLGSTGAAITSGTYNTTLGNNAGAALSGGASTNTLIGFSSGLNITTSFSNTAVGYSSLSSFTSGAANTGANTAIGIATLGNLLTGENNIGLGGSAGNLYAGSESSNIVIGSPGVALESNTIRIGNQGSGSGQQNRYFAAGVTGVTVAGSAPIAVDTNGQFSSLGFGTANQVLTSNGAGTSPTFQAASASGAITQITGSSGGAQVPSAGNFNILGTGSITSVGTANTETIQLTGLTNHSVLVGAGTATITKVAPSATSGIPLISQGASADPLFGTALVAGGGTGLTSTTAYGLIAGGTTTTGNFQNTGAGTSGQYLKSNGAAALPAFAALPSQASNASVYLNSTISNATGDGTFVTPVIFDTEFFDLGSNYDPTTGLFTIPTTGKYLVCVGITFTGLLVAHTSAEVRIVANGATVTRNQFNPFVASVSGQFTYCQSLVIAGTAAQTISIVSAVSGGTKVVGFLGASFGDYCVASFTFLG